MHVCPRENFNKDTVFITTLSGHGCFISQNDIRWVCFNDDNDHTRIWLTKDSPLVNLLGAEEIQTDDKVTFSLFYLGYDITEEIECSDQQLSWCEDFVDHALYAARHKKNHPQPLPPFPK